MMWSCSGNRRPKRTCAGAWITVPVVAAGFMASCARQPNAIEALDAYDGVTIENVHENPNRYAGKTVTLTGEIEDVTSPRVFRIGGAGWDFAEELLVITARPLLPVRARTADNPFRREDLVQVRGKVYTFNLAEVEQQTGVNLDDTQYRPYAGKPVVVADYVLVTPRAAGYVPVAGASAVTLEDLDDDAEEYWGKVVTVSGEVEALYGPRAFQLGGKGWLFDNEVLVIGSTPFPAVKNRSPGVVSRRDVVQVTGVVRKFILADAEREAGVDLDDGQFKRWEGEPVILAKSVLVNARR